MGTSECEKGDLGAQEYLVKSRIGSKGGWGRNGMSGMKESRRQEQHLYLSEI